MDLASEFNIHIPKNLRDGDNILVIDPQLDMRMILVHQLQKLNFGPIIQAKDAMDALEIMKENDVAAVICTMSLPQISGLELLSEMREDMEINRPPFCITMEQVSKEKLMLAVETGVDEILVKPFTLGDIAPKLRKAFKAFHNPKNPEKVYELAKQKLRSSRLDEAEEVFRRLHSSSPQAARPLLGLAKVAFCRKDFPQALEHLEKAESNNPQYVHIFELRGEIAIAQGHLKEAIKAYTHGIGLSPLNPNRYKKAGEILIKQELYQDASEILSMALSKKVFFKELYHFLSQSYYYLKDYQHSAKYIRKAVEKNPDNITYLNQLALSLKECGELEEAKKTYNQVIKLDPDNLQALFNKSIMLAQSGRIEEATKILERLATKYPDNEKIQSKLAELKTQKAS